MESISGNRQNIFFGRMVAPKLVIIHKSLFIRVRTNQQQINKFFEKLTNPSMN